MESTSTNRDATATRGSGNRTHSSGLSLRGNFWWTLAGNLVYAGCQWALLVCLAKLGTPAAVGQLALAFAITAPIIMCASLQLRTVQATDACFDYQFSDYLALRILSLLAAAIVIAGIVAVSHYNADTAIVILIIGAAKACESISDLFYGLLQQHERMDRIAISMAIKGFASVAAFASVYYLTRSVCLGALAMSGAWAIVLVLYDFRSGRLMLGGTRIGGSPIRPRWNRETVLELTRLSFPLGLVILMVSLHTSLPRYFLERYRGESALGVFAAMSYLLMAGTTVVAALGQATSPRLAKYYSDEQWCPFRKLLLALIGIAVVLGAGGLVLALVSGKEILTLIYRPEYAQNTDVFILMTLAAGIGFVASLVGYAVTSTRKFNRLILPTLITTIVGLVCCLALIPDFGLKGSAWTLCAISTANLVTNGLLLLRVMKTRKG